jgi:hypothetical protein
MPERRGRSRAADSPYVRSQNAEDAIVSAKLIASVIRRTKGLRQGHARKLLSEVIWFISEVDGKYTTRYRSKQVVDLARHYLKGRQQSKRKPNMLNYIKRARSEKIQHEHVNTRAALVDKLLRLPPQKVSVALEEVLACVVTKDEHRDLKGAAKGWARYRDAGIPVYDMKYKPPRLKIGLRKHR